MGIADLQAPIGLGESFGSNVCTVTLTADAPKSDPSVTRGLIIVVGTKEPRADAYTAYGNQFRAFVPTITDDSVPVPPYTGMANWVGTDLIVSHLVGVPGSRLHTKGLRAPGYWPHVVGCRGVYQYIVLTDLLAGDTITVDFSASITGWTMDWLSVQVHPTDCMPTPRVTRGSSHSGYPENDTWSISSGDFAGNPYFRQMLFHIACTPWYLQALTRSFYADSIPGIAGGLTGHGHSLLPSSSPDCALNYGWYDLTEQFGDTVQFGDFTHGSYPQAYTQIGNPGWPVSGEMPPGGVSTSLIEAPVTDCFGSVVGQPYPPAAATARPQIYRRI